VLDHNNTSGCSKCGASTGNKSRSPRLSSSSSSSCESTGLSGNEGNADYMDNHRNARRSAVRIAFHTADYSAAAVYPPTRPNRPVSSRKPSLLTLNPAPSIAKSKSKEPAAVVVEKEKEEEENEKVLHEALDSAVRHALEDAWQLPPHAPANGPHQAGAVDSDRRSEGDGGGVADPEQQPAPQRSLAELYADLEELGISAHELNEVLDEAMRSTGDR
jgi:hypothetical protein